MHYLSTVSVLLAIVHLMSCDIGIKFTRQPEPISAPIKDIVEFECGLNIPSDHVVWYHNGKQSGQNMSNTNKESKVSHSLTIAFNDISLAGEYQCVAWYGASAIISTSARLSLADMKPFSRIPDESYEVVPGNDIILACPSPDSTPAAYIQYLKDSTLLNNANLLQTTNSLLIKNTNETSSGVYTCMATNSITEQEYKSPFRFNVHVSNNLGRRSPYFLQDPQKKYAIEIGNNISIECNAVGNPKPKIYWSKLNENRLNNRSIDDGTLLTIINVEPQDSGVYTCKADNGISPTLSYNIEIEVQEAPKLVQEPEKLFSVTENEHIEFECSFRGNPTPRIDWYLNSKLLTPENNVLLNEGKLRINYVEKKHAGIYQCFGTNVIGSTFGITMLQVVPTQKQIFPGSDDNIFDDFKLINESMHHSQHHNHHENKKHKNKHHGGKNKGLKDVVMIPPTRPNITRLTDKSVMVRWTIPPNAGLPIQFFKVQYKEMGGNKNSRKSNKWMTSNEDIPSHIRSYEIDGLETNQTYRFRIAAVYSNNDNLLSPNSDKFHLHKGSNTNKNRPKPPSLTDTEAISPNIIQIHWEYLNSVLSPVDGFYIYYRASSNAGDYIKSTVEGQDIRSFNITHLQPNTPYEIKLQSFTVGSASDFSSILISRTLVDPNATTTTETTTEVINNTIETTNIMANNSSKTYYYVIIGVIVGLLTILGLLYFVTNIMRNKQKPDDADEDSNDNNKSDSLTIPQITDTPSTMNGFVNHSNSHATIPNGNIPNGLPPTAKLNGSKISNGYVNKSLVHSNHVSNDEDEPLNIVSTSGNVKPLPPRGATARDMNPIANITETINSNVDPREYETLNMIRGIHEMNPGTRESINIINNPLENNTQYNIELNLLSCMNKNNINNRNHPLQPTNRHNIVNRNKIDLDNIEYELGNNLPIEDMGNASLRMKHKLSNNNNNNKIINNNTKYGSQNNNNWRGRSVVDTRRTDNYM
uniref:Interference hedgehog n=2 Tax=Cacopsylla melanoneura TaxID=428564 RepID=A0A8D9F078_9HEMI